MPQEADHRRPKKNSSYERLRGSPFQSPGDLDAEEDRIRLEVWRRVTEARVFDELLTKPENAFIKRLWREGVQSKFGGDGEDICHAYADDDGVKLLINKDLYNTLPSQEVEFLESILRATLEGFENSYLRVRCLAKSEPPQNPDAKGLPARPGMKKSDRKDV